MKNRLLPALFICGITAQAQSILTQSFNVTSMPAGWTQTTLASDGGWKFGNAYQFDGLNMHYPPTTQGNFACTSDEKCQCNKTADRLISPVMNLSAYTNVFLSFESMFTTDFNWTTATVEVSTNGGSTWTVLQTLPSGPYDWNRIIYDLSAYAGQSNVKVSFLFNDNNNVNNWKGWGIRNVTVYAPKAVDVSVDKVQLKADYKFIEIGMIAQGTDTLFGTITNMGTGTITSLDLNYSVNGGTVQTQSLNGLSIPSRGVYNYTHSSLWNFNSPGAQTIKVWPTLVNGGNDQDNLNDTARKVTGVANSFVPRKLLFEDFTNAGCSPCVSFNASVLPVMNSNAAIATQLSYHVYWPSISDPMYQFNTTENNGRTNYYSVPGVPHGHLNGLSGYWFVGSSTGLQWYIDAMKIRPGFFDLNINATYNGSNIAISGNWLSRATFPSGNLVLHVALVEDMTYSIAPGPNGEKYFPAVMRKMFPNYLGTNIPLPSNGSGNTFNFNYAYNSSQILTANCRAIAYIQDWNTRHIYQAAWVPLSPTGLEEIAGIGNMSIYPNPCNGVFNLEMEASEEVVKLEVYNAFGQTVLSRQTSKLANQQIDLSGQPNGIYFVNIRLGEKTVTRKVSVQK